MQNLEFLNTLHDVKQHIPNAEIDLKYATTGNFVGQVVYDFKTCYLLGVVIEKLILVQAELAQHNLGLKIWDGYRPQAAQELFWQLKPDEDYVVHPNKGSRHTRGVAVDVTLIDLTTKIELEMPSGFDDFSECAHINYTDAAKAAITNRDLLIFTMAKYGFLVWKNEWWHFDLNGWEDYPLLDFVP